MVVPTKPVKLLQGFALVQHGQELSYATYPTRLDFSSLDSFVEWSICADYGMCQRYVIAQVEHCPASWGDAAFAVDTELDRICYVNGRDFVPGAVRNRLATYTACGWFDVLRAFLPCVTVKRVFTTNGPASSYKTSP